jgi:hypothetical protein
VVSWYILWWVGIFLASWYIFSRFGMLYREKSGYLGGHNVVQNCRRHSWAQLTTNVCTDLKERKVFFLGWTWRRNLSLPVVVDDGRAGLPHFVGTTNRNIKTIPNVYKCIQNGDTMYQMAVNIPHGHKICTYTKILYYNVLQKHSNLDFWLVNIPSGCPGGVV